MKINSILTEKWYKKFAKMAVTNPSKVFDFKNTIVNQPNLTLQFNNTIMNQPVTYRISNKYKHLNDYDHFDFKQPAQSYSKINKSSSKGRKKECILQQLNQFENEFDKTSSSKFLPNSRNFVGNYDHDGAKTTRSNCNKSRVSLIFYKF